MIEKLIGFFTGGLLPEVAKQVGDAIRARGEREIQKFMQEIAFDLELLKAGTGDPLHTRQGIAWTFHLFMWIHLFVKGGFPDQVIFTWGDQAVTVGFVYVVIIAFYFPFRAIERAKSLFPKR